MYYTVLPIFSYNFILVHLVSLCWEKIPTKLQRMYFFIQDIVHMYLKNMQYNAILKSY